MAKIAGRRSSSRSKESCSNASKALDYRTYGHPENFMVSLKGDGGYQVFMVDFGLCRFRGQDESDLNWGQAKYTKNEEGAVGLVMKMRLGKHGFELNYERSQRYIEWIRGEEEEGDPTENRSLSIFCGQAWQFTHGYHCRIWNTADSTSLRDCGGRTAKTRLRSGVTELSEVRRCILNC